MSHERDCLFGRFVVLVFALGLVETASPAWTWGDLCHKIICQIAYQELSDRARNELTRLITLDATFDSFPDAWLIPYFAAR